MKRQIFAALLASAMLLLTACGSPRNTPGSTGPGETQAAAGDTGSSAPDTVRPEDSQPDGAGPDSTRTPPEIEAPGEDLKEVPADDGKGGEPAGAQSEVPPPADPEPAEPKPEEPSPEVPADPASGDGQPEEQPGDAGDTEAEAGDAVNLKDFYTAAAGKYELPMGTAELTDGEMIDYIYPGLKDIALKQQALYITMMSLNNGELSMVEVENEADADTVKTIFETRVQGMADGGAWYPGPTEIWTNQSRVKVYGNYVLLAVGENCDAITADFEALVK